MVIVRCKAVYNLGIAINIPQIDDQVLHRFKNAVLGIGTVATRKFTPYGKQRQQYLYRCHSFEGCQAIVALLWKFLSPVKKQQIENQLYFYHEQNALNIQWRKK